jgi:hypothetical protein
MPEELLPLKKKRITIQSGKAKGRRLQQWFAKQIAELTGFEYGKDCDIESRPMGQSGIDVRMSKQVLEIFPYSPETKCCESWAVHQWIEQAKANQLPNTDWVICAKRNHSDPVVIIDAKVFFKILKGT